MRASFVARYFLRLNGNKSLLVVSSLGTISGKLWLWRITGCSPPSCILILESMPVLPLGAAFFYTEFGLFILSRSTFYLCDLFLERPPVTLCEYTFVI